MRFSSATRRVSSGIPFSSFSSESISPVPACMEKAAENKKKARRIFFTKTNIRKNKKRRWFFFSFLCSFQLLSCFLFYFQRERVLDFFAEQGVFNQFSHFFNIMKRQAFQVVALDLFYVPAVLGTQNDFLNARALGCKYFFFYSAYRQHTSAERNLARHGHVLFHFTL